MPIFLNSKDKQAYLDYFDNSGDIWVFAYGSLIWRPDFPYISSHRAKLLGYHRAFCLRSYHYRGTETCPGLVLALNKGGECDGVVLKISPGHEYETLEALWMREMISYAYKPMLHPLTLDATDQEIQALTFVIDTEHTQYAGDLSEDEVLKSILQAEGSAGKNVDYLLQTHNCLKEMNINDDYIASLAHKAMKVIS